MSYNKIMLKDDQSRIIFSKIYTHIGFRLHKSRLIDLYIILYYIIYAWLELFMLKYIFFEFTITSSTWTKDSFNIIHTGRPVRRKSNNVVPWKIHIVHSPYPRCSRRRRLQSCVIMWTWKMLPPLHTSYFVHIINIL